ncbi:UNVERIFIED_CONTAM: hypothetical protein FKN15_069091 [Acipenser sinensis]
MASLSWRNPDPARVRRLASQSRRDSLSSPSLEEPFFPFPSQRRESMGSPLPPPLEHTSSELLERDLILAAELGQALLERNEELGAKLEERDREIEWKAKVSFPRPHFRFVPLPLSSSLEAELDRVRSERDSLNLQLFNTIQHKVALAQEVEDWQEDMRVVITQQVRVQSEEEREKERKASVKRKDRSQFNRRSFRGSGEGSEGGSKEGFFSSLFKQN